MGNTLMINPKIRLLTMLLGLALLSSITALVIGVVRNRTAFLIPEMSRDRPPEQPVDFVMIHFCSEIVENKENPFDINAILRRFVQNRVSAHYLIDRNGGIHRLVDENRAAFHAGKGELPWLPSSRDKMNERSIGIELTAIGSEGDMKPFLSNQDYNEIAQLHPDWIGFTGKQYAALKDLLKEIVLRHPRLEFDRCHIIGHEEYASERRTDPGELFDYSKLGLEKSAGRPCGNVDT